MECASIRITQPMSHGGENVAPSVVGIGLFPVQLPCGGLHEVI